jgi:hypothetical protein
MLKTLGLIAGSANERNEQTLAGLGQCLSQAIVLQVPLQCWPNFISCPERRNSIFTLKRNEILLFKDRYFPFTSLAKDRCESLIVTEKKKSFTV